ncbi:MAG: hypothetical protein JO225_03175 [Candidatus Eremiobacteraeota bacterium]|nr:hypothetical protein [Candidatus Eremiobacteraeota bacterium]
MTGITIVQNALSANRSSFTIPPLPSTVPASASIAALAFDGAGNLWVMALGPSTVTINSVVTGVPVVFEFPAPLSGSSTVTRQISAGMALVPEPLSFPASALGFDPSGNLYVLTGNPTYGNVIYEYAPPYSQLTPIVFPLSSSVTAPANPLPIDTAGGTYLSRSAAGGVATTALEVLYYAGPLLPPSTSLGSNVAAGVGSAATPTLQFTATSFPVSAQPIAVHGLAEDASGDLIVGMSNGTLEFFTAPLSTSSAPTATVACPLDAITGTCTGLVQGSGVGAVALGP